ncbi:type 2 lanthipeptide synthetase LanM family protein [Polymorphospora sp. NPDC050346]|uniref:type 2 lanthipeptide synthetase LanM family protein n=1 Tax=Polymorphospora sp. NPDC050346 TaxID=3155780 RepID=UPI0033ED336D
MSEAATGVYDDVLGDPSWWRALPLRQRRGAPAGSPGQREDGTRRLDIWRDGVLFNSDERSLDRWHDLGVTDDELVTLLGEPAASLAARLPGPPDFLTVIARAWRRYDHYPAADLNIAGIGADGDHDGHGHDGHDHDGCDHGQHEARGRLGFLEVARPLLAWAHETLRERLGTLAAAHGHPPDLPHAHPLLRFSPDRAMAMVSRVMVLEVNVARVEGRLTGATPEERFASFVDQLRHPARSLALLAEYPVLARELVELLRRWIEARLEFVERLLADLPDLRHRLGLTVAGLDGLVDVRFGAGDSHRGGRTVAVLTFVGGHHLVYKPRSIGVETRYNALLDWLNRRGLEHQLMPLRTLDRGSHGWVEFVRAAACADEEQVRRFYWRHGAYLALFHAIRGSDFHLENVIAAGEHPVFVDLEAIFQAPPKVSDSDVFDLLGAAPEVLRASVLGTGLLPQRLIEFDENGFRDTEISALAGGDNQLSPDLAPTFADIGTDRMRAVRERRPMAGADNLARLDGEVIDPRRYRNQILAGFESCYRLIEWHRDELIAADGPIAAFRGAQVRFVPRGTMVYARMLFESFHPDVLRDSLDREFLFEAAVCTGHLMTAHRDRLLDSELRQLAEQDVPCFHTATDSRDLFDTEGVVIPGFLDAAGIDAALAQIRRMGSGDRDRQTWCIEASFAGLTVGAAESAPMSPVAVPTEPIDLARAVRAAGILGDQLLDAALVGDDQPPHWLSLTNLAERYWTVGPAGTGLYDGTSGIALFLAQLAALSGQDRYRQPAERLARQMADCVSRYKDSAELRSVLAVGGFNGVGGIVYALTTLATLWDAPELIKPVPEMVPELAERFSEDKGLDVIEGTAGAGLALVGLYRIEPDERVLAAIRAAERTLADRAAPTGTGTAWSTGIEAGEKLLGYAHGASGFAHALAEMASVTGNTENYDLCAGALRFERDHLSRTRGNWPDLRGISPDDTYLNTWCHGAAGIGLARAAMTGLPGLADMRELIDEDLRIALDTVQRDLVRDGVYTGIGSDCLCHGDLGLVETLYAGAAATRQPELSTLGRRLAGAVADRVLAGDLRPGVPSWVPTPGLLMGAAGIGYGLLRAAAPEHVPNVLTLAVVPRGSSRDGDPN